MQYPKSSARPFSSASEALKAEDATIGVAATNQPANGKLSRASSYTSSIMDAYTQPFSQRSASRTATTAERVRVALALAIVLLYLGLIGLLVYAVNNPSEVTIQAGLDQRGHWTVKWILPAGFLYEKEVRVGDTITRLDGVVIKPGTPVPADFSGHNTLTIVTRTGQSVVVNLGPRQPDTDLISYIQSATFYFLGFIFITVGGLVFAKARQRPAASAFFVFCASTAVTLALAVGIASNIEWIQSMLFVSLVVFAGSFTYFFFQFPSPVGRNTRQHRLIISALAVAGIVTVVAYARVLLIVDAASDYEWVRMLMFAYLSACVAAGLANLVRPLLGHPTPEVRQQLWILMGGTGVAVGLPLLLSVIPQFFLGREIVSVYLTAIALVIMPLAFAYAITQHQLLGVRSLVRRGVVYVVMGSSVLLVFCLSAAIVSYIVPEGWSRSGGGLVGFSFFVFLIALSFGYLQRRVEHYVDKFIYHDAYDYKEALLQFSSQLASEQDLNVLSNQLVERTCRLMNLVCGVLLLAVHPDSEQASGPKYSTATASLDGVRKTSGPMATLESPSTANGAANGENAGAGQAHAADLSTAVLDGWSADNYLSYMRMQPQADPEGPAHLTVYARHGDSVNVMVAGLQDELSRLGVELHGSEITVLSLSPSGGSHEGSALNAFSTTSSLVEGGSAARVGSLADAVAIPGVTEILSTAPLSPLAAHGEAELARSFLGVPLWTRSRFVGVLCLAGKRTGERFTRDDLSLLNTLGSQAALAIYNAQLSESREQGLLDTIAALAHAIEAKDGYTSEHCERMTDRAVAVAQAMNLSRQEVENVRLGAILHDVGKIGVPDAVLNKPGKLTPEEYEIIKQHATIGAGIVQTVKALKGVVPIVLHHQERYDGSGYPYGLAGQDIPVGARIIGVVDTYGAMTEDRIYRKAPGHSRAVTELRQLAGRQFDPEVVDVFLKVLDEHPELAEFLTGPHAHRH